MADKVGALTVVAPLTLVAGALTFAWPFVTTKGGLIGIALIYGYVDALSCTICINRFLVSPQEHL